MVGNIVSKVEPGSPALGALAGLLALDHHGLPVWFVAIAITVSLVFGMTSAAMRSKDPDERAEASRTAKGNAGALWVLSCVTVWQADMQLPGAMMTALVLGLLGTRALEALENRWLAPGGSKNVGQ